MSFIKSKLNEKIEEAPQEKHTLTHQNASLEEFRRVVDVNIYQTFHNLSKHCLTSGQNNTYTQTGYDNLKISDQKQVFNDKECKRIYEKYATFSQVII